MSPYTVPIASRIRVKRPRMCVVAARLAPFVCVQVVLSPERRSDNIPLLRPSAGGQGRPAPHYWEFPSQEWDGRPCPSCSNTIPFEPLGDPG